MGYASLTHFVQSGERWRVEGCFNDVSHLSAAWRERFCSGGQVFTGAQHEFLFFLFFFFPFSCTLRGLQCLRSQTRWQLLCFYWCDLGDRNIHWTTWGVSNKSMVWRPDWDWTGGSREISSQGQAHVLGECFLREKSCRAVGKDMFFWAIAAIPFCF